MSSEAIEQWLSLQPANIKSSVKFSHVDEVGPLYHVSLDGGINKFIPFVTRRASNKENVSVPRVSTAPTIMGCLIGYMASWSDIAWPGDKIKSKKFKNGWYLYELSYEYCIKPNKKLLFDQENSDEHWLVTYTPETREYRSTIVAKLFYAEMKILPRTGKYPEHHVQLVVEVMREGGVRLGGDKVLDKGIWVIEGPLPEDPADWSNIKPYTVNKIGYGEYAKLKGLSADMLSLNPPAAFKW